MDHFGGFLGPFSPKYGWILVKVWPEVVYKKKKTEYGQSFKIIFLRETGRTKSLQFWAIFGTSLSPENKKYCQKTKSFPENASLGISN